MSKQKYEKPELKVLQLSSDVIVASGDVCDDVAPCPTDGCVCVGYQPST